MKSVILQTATKFIMPLLLIFSFFLLLRGHYEPGGGFVGGLVAALAYSLYSISYDVNEAKILLRIEPIYLIAGGLLIAFLSTIPSLAYEETFFTGIWFEPEFPIVGKIGTPLIFDIGVYFVVLGIATKILFTLLEQEQNK